MPLLASRDKTPTDKKRYTVSYEDWLDLGETLSTVVFDVDIGPADVDSVALSGDGKSVTFRVFGGSTAYSTFNVMMEATTSLGQIKNDHMEFSIVDP